MKTNLSIDVNVTVNFSDEARNVLAHLATAFLGNPGCCCGPTTVEKEGPIAIEGVAVTEESRAMERAAKKSAKAEESAPSNETAKEEPAKPVDAPKAAKAAEPAPIAKRDIEDVRKVLAEKLDQHRPAIKAKLTELNAPSVTKLDPAHYNEMYEFLVSL